MKKDLSKYIDHTNLKPDAGIADITLLCSQAREYGFASVCINPCYVPLAKRLLEGSGVSVCTVIGFPLGATTTAAKVAETIKAYEDGCDEFDMVINIGMLKSRDHSYVLDDIEAVVKAAKGRTVKVIIETGLLTNEEKVIACRLASEAGAHFVKTCTGMSAGKATVQDVQLMKECVFGNVLVKASAGIRTYEDAINLLNAGADRLGTSAGIEIIK